MGAQDSESSSLKSMTSEELKDYEETEFCPECQMKHIMCHDDRQRLSAFKPCKMCLIKVYRVKINRMPDENLKKEYLNVRNKLSSLSQGDEWDVTAMKLTMVARMVSKSKARSFESL